MKSNNIILTLENFKWDELACRCCNKMEMLNSFLVCLQAFRYFLNDKHDKNVRLNIVCKGTQKGSGYRCFAHNLVVGGVSDSRHVAGDAVDMYTYDISIEQLFESAKKFKLFNTVIWYKRSGFVHVDRRLRKRKKYLVWSL